MEKIDKIKLMMGYDLTKTLNENVESMNIILENEINEAGEATVAKDLESALKGSTEDLAKIDTGLAKSGVKDVKSLKDLESALKDNKLAASDVSLIRKNIINTLDKTSPLYNQMVDNLTSKSAFYSKYRNYNQKEITQQLSKFYGPEKASDIASKFVQKEQSGFFKDLKDTDVNGVATNNPTKTTLDSSDANKKLGDINNVSGQGNTNVSGQGHTITQTNNYYINNGSGQISVDWKKTRGKKVTFIDPETGKPVTVTQPKPTPEPPVKDPSKFSKLTNVLKSKWLWALGAIGLSTYAFYKLFHNSTPPIFNKCLADLVNDNSGTILATTSGDPVVVVKQYPGYPQFDSLGGLWFYQNGRVMTADKGQTKRGNFTCTGGGIEIKWDGEGVTPQPNPNPNPNPQPNPDTTTTNTETQPTDTTAPTPTNTENPPTTTPDNSAAAQTNAGLANMIKTSDNKPQEKTPEIEEMINQGKEIYTKLYNNYKTKGRPKPFIKQDGDLLKYKGEKLPGNQLNPLNQYIKSLGYSYMKQKDKEYVPLEDDVKYVWKKNTEPQVQEPQPQAQEPEQLSEQFIKNIVGKHLRSKL